jgi:hypothetical protein
MEKEFITYELALRMKALGFDEPCFGFYDGWDNNKAIGGNYPCDGINSAPLFSQAFRWFRGKYNIHIRIEKFDETKWWANWGSWTSEFYDSYEEAELHCLEKLMDIVEQKNSK